MNSGECTANQVNLAFPGLAGADGSHLNAGITGVGILDVVGGFTHRFTVDDYVSVGLRGNLDAGFFGKRVELTASKEDRK